MKAKILSGWFSIIFGICSVSAAKAQPVQDVSISTAEHAAIRKQLEVFQGVIETTVKQNISGPFSILCTPRGVYLPEYGSVVYLEVNLYKIRIISPFSSAPHSQKELDAAYDLLMSRIDTLRTHLLRAISEHGGAIQELKPTDNVTVVAHLFNGYNDPQRPAPSQLLFTVKKSMLNDYREKKVTFAELAKQIDITEF